jgi:hypothetical protein
MQSSDAAASRERLALTNAEAVGNAAGQTNYPTEPPLIWYIPRMTIEDLEKAVATLPPDQFAEFRAWFEEFDAARFDQKIERDIKAGELDPLADQAIDDFRKGRARELGSRSLR